MKLLYDNIAVKQFDGPEKSAGGIDLPDTIESPPEGEVVAVGPGRLQDDGTTVPMSVKVGDHIIWAKFVGGEVKVKDEKFVIIKEKDVLMIIDAPVVHA